ncbi:MAG: agmatinase [Microbacteriaceae bacterium]
MNEESIIGPVDGTKVPRYAGAPTFARLPRIDEVSRYDVSVLGAPFDGGVSFRPGARFGPSAIRQASRNLRPAFHPDLGVSPFRVLQAVDAGDVPCNPFDIDAALQQIDDAAGNVIGAGRRLITLGGDHTVALGSLRAVVKEHGPVALIHFDAHLDTWDSYFGADRTHGTVFRRAFEEGLLLPESSIHVGIRGPLYDAQDLVADAGFGFSTIRAGDFDRLGAAEVVGRARQRVGDAPVYLSVDIDVLDPAFAPGTGTPEMGGFTSRELLTMLRGLPGEQLVAADVVEVSPVYDHAEITSLAAATIAYEVISLMAGGIPATTRAPVPAQSAPAQPLPGAAS